MAYRPPAKYSVSTNRQGYKTLEELPDSIPTWTTNSGKSNSNKRRRMADEDSYFDDDDDPPPPSRSTYDPFNPTEENSQAQSGGGDEDEIDPLDAFMAMNNAKAAVDQKNIGKSKPKQNAFRADIEKKDSEEQFYDYIKVIFFIILFHDFIFQGESKCRKSIHAH